MISSQCWSNQSLVIQVSDEKEKFQLKPEKRKVTISHDFFSTNICDKRSVIDQGIYEFHNIQKYLLKLCVAF